MPIYNIDSNTIDNDLMARIIKTVQDRDNGQQPRYKNRYKAQPDKFDEMKTSLASRIRSPGQFKDYIFNR